MADAPEFHADSTVVDEKIGRAETAKPHQVIADRYEVIARIGEGGMGKVYRVRHTQLGNELALKIISTAASRDDVTREQFFREAKMASNLDHAGVAKVIDFGEDLDVGMFMVMEYISGTQLSVLLHREGKLPPRLACDFAEQIALALDYIHGHQIVHCDIKTENILVTEMVVSNGRRLPRAKLLDFGLARSAENRNDTTLSGTPHYVAPERIRGEVATPASDVYSVGILLYELLTGRVPWDGATSEILSGHLDHVPAPPSTLVENLDPAIDRLVLRALAKTPATRHRSMTEFLYELRTVSQMLGFGRKRPAAAGVQKAAARDEMCRLLVENTPLAMAVLDAQGSMVFGNAPWRKQFDTRQPFSQHCPSFVANAAALAEGATVTLQVGTQRAQVTCAGRQQFCVIVLP